MKCEKAKTVRINKFSVKEIEGTWPEITFSYHLPSVIFRLTVSRNQWNNQWNSDKQRMKNKLLMITICLVDFGETNTKLQYDHQRQMYRSYWSTKRISSIGVASDNVNNVNKFSRYRCCIVTKKKLILIFSAGIGNRAIRPTLGIVDPLHTLHMPARVTANSGFDVFW